MNRVDGEQFLHHHHVPVSRQSERRTQWVVAITLTMMVAEIGVGYATHSLALLADGWHMATHAGALGLSAFAYWFARTRSQNSDFTFGTGKVYALAGYTNALLLFLVAGGMVMEALRRLVRPEAVDFAEAIPVAVIGLVVNLVSAKLLDDHGHHDHHGHEDAAHGHHHDHHDDHDHGHDHDHAHAHDHNLRAAYMHVVADALTSVLAIVALLAGRYAGVASLDPLVAILGSVVIAKWAVGLCRQAARQLLDVSPSQEEERAIRTGIEALGDRVVDLHLWELGPAHRGCILSVVALSPRPLDDYKQVVLSVSKVRHLTIEVHAPREAA